MQGTYNWRRVTLHGLSRRGHGTEQGTVAFVLEHLDCAVGQGGAGLLEGLKTRLEICELELEAQGRGKSLEGTAACGDDFTTNTITGDEACGYRG